MKGILILIISLFVLTGVLCFVIFYNGGKKNIHISRKYIENVSDDGKNYIIECKFGGNKEKLHKLKCDKEMYEKFRMGSNYTIKVKASRVAKVIK